MRRLTPLLLAFACSAAPPPAVPPSETEDTGEERTAPTEPPEAAGADPPFLFASPAAASDEPARCPSAGVHDLPDAGGYPGMARLVWTGSHYLQLWYEREREGRDFRLFVQRLDADLEPLEDVPRRLFPNTPEQSSRSGVQVALGDGVVGLVYKHSRTEMRPPPPRPGPPDGMPPRPSPFGPQTGPQPTLVAIETRFLRLDLDGEPVGAERAVAPDAAPWNGDHAALAWDPETRRWGVAFEGSEPGGADRRLYFAELDEGGQLAGDPLVLSSTQYALGSAAQSVVARPGGGFTVAWGDRHPTLAEIGDGVRRVTLAQLAGGSEGTILTDGRHYVVAFTAGTPAAVHLAGAAGVDPIVDLAQPVGAAGRYSGSADLRVGAEGLEVVYVQQDEQGRSRIHRRVLTERGLGEPTPLTDDESGESHGWPIFAEGDGPCPGLFSYLSFGGRDANLHASAPEAALR